MLSKNDFYSKCCRVCGNKDGFYINLLENSENDYMIKIQNLLPIKIEADDNLPKNLCHLCIAKLNDFHELRENCIKMQAALSAIASTWNKNEEREISYDGASAGILHKFNENEPPCRTIRDKNEALRLEKGLTKQNDKRMEETNFDKKLNSCSKGSQQHNRSKNDESIRNKDTAASTELEGWTIQRLPNTTLYICNKCSEILVYESATKSHRCRTSSHVMHILPINDPVNQNEKDSGKSDVTSEDENTCRKKRKRIYFGGDD